MLENILIVIGISCLIALSLAVIDYLSTKERNKKNSIIVLVLGAVALIGATALTAFIAFSLKSVIETTLPTVPVPSQPSHPSLLAIIAIIVGIVLTCKLVYRLFVYSMFIK